jgi:hypothetical protein
MSGHGSHAAGGLGRNPAHTLLRISWPTCDSRLGSVSLQLARYILYMYDNQGAQFAMEIRESLFALFMLITTSSFGLERSYAASLPSADDVNGILKACAGGRFQRIEKNVENKIDSWKQDAELSGTVSQDDLGAILKHVPQDQQLSPDDYKIYTDCILSAMSKYLGSQSVSSHPMQTFRVCTGNGGGPSCSWS